MNRKKIFSSRVEKNKTYQNYLFHTSNNDPVTYESRLKCYDKVMDNLYELVESKRGSSLTTKLFSTFSSSVKPKGGSARLFSGESGVVNNFGVTGTDLPGQFPMDFVDITLLTSIRSIVPFLAREVSLDNPSALIYTLDIIDKVTDEVAFPNVGSVTENSLQLSKFNHSQTIQSETLEYVLVTGTMILPGTVNLNVRGYTVKDNGGGLLVAPGEVGLDAGSTVDYRKGKIVAKFIEDKKLVTGDKVTLSYDRDTPTTPINGYRSQVRSLTVETQPQVVLVENNLINNVTLKKSTGMDPYVTLQKRVVEFYTQKINKLAIDQLSALPLGTPLEINLQDTANNKAVEPFNATLLRFNYQLTQLGSELLRKANQATHLSTLLVGNGVSNLIASIPGFRVNQDVTYIDSLIGYLGNIAVVRSGLIPDWDGYAIHKTPGGEVAPLIRPMYLPLTDLPEAVNYNNPAQTQGGLYSRESVAPLEPKLALKFTVIPPDNFKVTRSNASVG